VPFRILTSRLMRPSSIVKICTLVLEVPLINDAITVAQNDNPMVFLGILQLVSALALFQASCRPAAAFYCSMNSATSVAEQAER
jgi:hypothetical protein